MCGICGMIKFNHKEAVQKEILERMSKSLFHRGPDDSGFYIEGNVGLAVQRLSIIDIEGGHQPMHNEDNTVWLAFNGEIFNFQELRNDLVIKGHNFYTHSDSEVILHLYEEFDLDCVKMLNGMFAFAIWDKNKKRLILAVDRFGIKPLHYFLDNSNLVFASEIKGLLQLERIDKTIDYTALEQYFTYNCIASSRTIGRTIFKTIKKILPGSLLIYESEKIKIKKYWDIEFKINKNMDEEFIQLKLKELLRRSVQNRLISDVPLGVFLSGGIDSSIVTALATQLSPKRIKTFSMGFDVHSYNELKYAKIIAKRFNTEHHEFTVGAESIIDSIPKIMDTMDEPYGNTGIIPTYLICKLARQHITVALSGDGGDELFGGYGWTARQRIIETLNRNCRFLIELLHFIFNKPFYKKIPRFTSFAKLSRFIQDAINPPIEGCRRRLTCFTDDFKKGLYSEELKDNIRQADKEDLIKEYFDYFKDSDLLDRMLAVDLRICLIDDGLFRVDRMSMANSLEVRVPMLDNELVEFVLTIPNNLKIKGLITKYILRKAFSDLLPAKTLTHRKYGFSIPIDIWLRRELRDFVTDILNSAAFRKRGLFNQKYVSELIKNHFTGKDNFGYQLWNLIVFECWARRYLD
jgi:asparagine synthase (glutamine-hydrolysing)